MTFSLAPMTMEGYYKELDHLYAKLEVMQRDKEGYSRKDFLTVIHQIRDLRLQNPFYKQI